MVEMCYVDFEAGYEWLCINGHIEPIKDQNNQSNKYRLNTIKIL